MKKNNLFLWVIVSLLFSLNSSSYAIAPVVDKSASVEVQVKDEKNANITEEEENVIKKFSLKTKFQRSPESQIQSFIKKFNRYAEKNDMESLKKMYSDSFVNNDGFDKKTLFEMMSLAIDAYKDIKYTTTIEEIKIQGDYASVKAHETAQGLTAKSQVQVKDYGLVNSDIYYTDYLRKEGGTWKLLSSVITSEKLSLRYGQAKKMNISIEAPDMIPAGCDYNVKVTTTSPDGVFMVGSIVNEPIIHPQISKKDVFKGMKSDVLERVLTSNTDNHNEYASVTIGITVPVVNPPEMSFDMVGMAFVMSRVNVVNKKNDNNKNKEIVDAKK